MKHLELLNLWMSRKSVRALACAGLLPVCMLAMVGLSAAALAELPALDADVLLKPLVDTSQRGTSQRDTSQTGVNQSTGNQNNATTTTLQGKAEQKGTVPVNDEPSASKPLVLTGKVQTLQQAIESEKDTVDWYGWYLSAREYLGQTGGLRCALGTPIKFYKNGLIEAMSFDPHCIDSVSGRHFPLPPNTQLDALILPVRPGQGPPASRQEIYSRVHSLQYQ